MREREGRRSEEARHGEGCVFAGVGLRWFPLRETCLGRERCLKIGREASVVRGVPFELCCFSKQWMENEIEVQYTVPVRFPGNRL